MFLPASALNGGAPGAPGSRAAAPTPLSAAMAELEAARDDVMQQAQPCYLVITPATMSCSRCMTHVT